MKFNLKVLESTNQISKLILEDLKILVDNTINKSIKDISEEVKSIVSESLRNQPEYSSLMAGTLKAEFGIRDTSSIVSIIDALINTLELKKKDIKVTNNGLVGGFILTMLKTEDINSIVSLDVASVQDQDGYVLPWLNWLLYKGNEIIVKNYEVTYGAFPYSRSGMAIMKPSDESWRVPPEFSGTEDNNWVTRAVNSVEDNIYKAIQNNIEKNA